MSAPNNLPPVQDYPRTKWAVAGYVLAHPRTWCLLLAAIVSWQCLGLKEWFHHNTAAAFEAAANAAEHHGGTSEEP